MASDRLFYSLDELDKDFNKEIKPLDQLNQLAIETDIFFNDQNKNADKESNADFSLFDGLFNLGNQVDFNNQADYDATNTKEVDVRISPTAFSPIVLFDFEEEPHYYADQKVKRKKISERNSERNDDDEWKEEENLEQDIISYDDNPKRKEPQESLYVRKVQNGWMCTFPECDKIYKTKKNLLKQHIESEHEGVTYSCTKCNKTYKNQSGLSYHIKSQHEGITYLCTECNKTFTRKSKLSEHTKSQHEGVTYSCTECYKTFNSKNGLSEHTKSQHEGVTYSCTECYKTFNCKSNLSQHIKSQHEGITYSCTFPGCNASYKDRSDLSRHIKTKHQDITSSTQSK